MDFSLPHKHIILHVNLPVKLVSGNHDFFNLRRFLYPRFVVESLSLLLF